MSQGKCYQTNVVSMADRSRKCSDPEIKYCGVVGIMRYDPHSPRCFEGIRLNLSNGKPCLVRLHAAADYPTSGDEKYQVDLEGQAILIVGYDDEKQAFAIVDPFCRHASRAASIDWLSYEDLAKSMVDCSRGNDILLCGMDVVVCASETAPVLDILIGLPSVYGTIMDHEDFVLKQINATATLQYDGVVKDLVLAGVSGAKECYRVGEMASFRLDLPVMSGEYFDIEISANAVIHANRPYEYADEIGTDYRHRLAIPELARSRALVNS